MKIEYNPLNLVMNGRYAVLYGKLSPEEQEAVLQRVGALIEAEKEWQEEHPKGTFNSK